jgi:hypothetical protein
MKKILSYLMKTILASFLAGILVLLLFPLIHPPSPEIQISQIEIGRGRLSGNLSSDFNTNMTYYLYDPTILNMKIRFSNLGDQAGVIDDLTIWVKNSSDFSLFQVPHNNIDLSETKSTSPENKVSFQFGNAQFSSLNIFSNFTRTSYIAINSIPEGASIYLDNMDVGKLTNTRLTDITPGNHSIRLNLPGYYDSNISILAVPGETILVYSQLLPISPPGPTMYVSELYPIEINRSEISRYFNDTAYNKPFVKKIPLNPPYEIYPHQEESLGFYFIDFDNSNTNYSMKFDASYDNKIVSSSYFPLTEMNNQI